MLSLYSDKIFVAIAPTNEIVPSTCGYTDQKRANLTGIFSGQFVLAVTDSLNILTCLI